MFSNEEGAWLDLQGPIPDPVFAELSQVPTEPYRTGIILGTIDGGLTCTLVEVLAARMGDWPRIWAQYVLLGDHYNSISDIRFRYVSFRFPHLEEWTDLTAIEPPESAAPHVVRLRPMSSPFDPNILFKTESDGVLIEITAAYSPSFGFRRFSVEEIARIQRTSAAPQSLDDLLVFVQDCRNFFTIAFGRDTKAFDIHLYAEPPGSLGPPTSRCNLFFSGMGSLPQEDVHPSDMLFSRQTLHDQPELLDNWIRKSPVLRRAVNWFLSGDRMKGPLEIQFLTYTQAVEALHRLQGGDSFVEPVNFEAIEKALLEAIPDGTPNDLKRRLEDTIHYANEFSLRRRLKELIKHSAPNVVGDAPFFIERIVLTRNCLVHNDPEITKRAASGSELSEITQKLRLIIILFLLQEAGMTRDRASALLQRMRWMLGS